MDIKLSDHFSYRKLLRFTLPSIIMMVFTSIYGVVDGIFVSNFAGKTAFAAVNFIMPFLMILSTLGFMIGTGGGALIAKTMGEGDNEHAHRLFSLFVYVAVALGIVLMVLGILFIRPITAYLGADGELLDNCVLYGRIILAVLPANILQLAFQSFMITAEKPQLGLKVTVASGLTNIVLDALFIGAFHWGLVGAAVATAISQLVGGVFPVFYFSRPNSSRLRLTRCSFDGRALLRCCVNGSSELMTNVAMSLVSMLYNIKLMEYAGQNGVAAYGVMMYVNFVFLAVFIGYSIGTAPIIGYHFGAGNKPELQNMLKKSVVIIGGSSVVMLLLSQLLAYPLSAVFVSYDGELLEMTCSGFRIFSLSFLMAGFAIFGSSFFTALSDGLTSALISFLRTLLFQVCAILLLPMLWGINGIWLSVVAAEVMAVATTAFFVYIKRKKYGYF